MNARSPDAAASEALSGSAKAALSVENRWLGDMMILQVLADSANVNEQEREVLARWLASSSLPLGESAGSARSDEKAPAVGVGSPVSTAMEVLRQLVEAKSTEDRLHRLHEMGHGTDWDQHRKHFAAAWDRAKALVSAQGATR